MNCGRTYRAVPQDYGPESIERSGNTTKNKVELTVWLGGSMGLEVESLRKGFSDPVRPTEKWSEAVWKRSFPGAGVVEAEERC